MKVFDRDTRPKLKARYKEQEDTIKKSTNIKEAATCNVVNIFKLI